MTDNAMTPDEWAEAYTNTCHGDGDPMGCDICFGQYQRHAQAALALHQQPFGFHDDDRALLRLLVEVLPRRGGIADEHIARLTSLADRIEAMLPPPTNLMPEGCE